MRPVRALKHLSAWFGPKKYHVRNPFYPLRFEENGLCGEMGWARHRHTDYGGQHACSSCGGAPALFSSGIDWVNEQRWGRWRSFTFHEYVWRDSESFLHLGERIASTHGLNRFLADVPPLHVRHPTEELPDFHNGRSVTTNGVLFRLDSPAWSHWSHCGYIHQLQPHFLAKRFLARYIGFAPIAVAILRHLSGSTFFVTRHSVLHFQVIILVFSPMA